MHDAEQEYRDGGAHGAGLTECRRPADANQQQRHQRSQAGERDEKPGESQQRVFLSGEFRHYPKAELATLRLVAAYVVIPLFMRASGDQLREIGSLIESGIIRPVMDRVFPFESTKEALAYVETGRAKGKVVVKVR